MNRLRIVTLLCLAFLMLIATFAAAADNSVERSVNSFHRQSPLVQTVQQATSQFKDVRVAIEAGLCSCFVCQWSERWRDGHSFRQQCTSR